MRLKCEVDAVLRPLPGCNVRKTGRPSQSFITVGKEGSKQVNMLISTAKNRNGNKYMLSNNILKIHARFVDEGKATICLKDPEVDICISKSDAIQLKALLNILRCVAKGDDVTLSIGTVQAPSASGMKALQTTMAITSRKDYPITTSFPPHLQSLTITGISMKRLDERIQRLRHLQTLGLSNNLLTALPDTTGQWSQLSSLDLSFNQLTSLPPVLYRSCLKNTLAVLKMNSNQLQVLPLQLCEMRGLKQLHVDDNKLTALPPTIGNLSQLFVVSAQRNQICQLPACMARLRLESLDLFGNPIRQIQSSEVLSSNLDTGIPSLKEVAARFIKTKKLRYTEDDLIPQLIFYLNNARVCWCGRYCFESCVRYLSPCELSKLSSTVRAWDASGRTVVPLESFLCSQSCLTKFQNNSHAYWR